MGCYSQGSSFNLWSLREHELGLELFNTAKPNFSKTARNNQSKKVTTSLILYKKAYPSAVRDCLVIIVRVLSNFSVFCCWPWLFVYLLRTLTLHIFSHTIYSSHLLSRSLCRLFHLALWQLSLENLLIYPRGAIVWRVLCSLCLFFSSLPPLSLSCALCLDLVWAARQQTAPRTAFPPLLFLLSLSHVRVVFESCIL